MIGRDDVGRQAPIRECAGDRGGEADRRQAGMDGQADPRPFAVREGRDQRHAFGFPDQREYVRRQRRVGIEQFEPVALVVQHRPHLREEPAEVGYSSCFASHCSSHLIV